MNSETIYMKIIINELDLIKKQLLFNEASEKRFTIISYQIKTKIPYPSNTKKYYQFYLKKKNTKLVKRSKTLEIPNIVDLKSVTIKHPKPYHKLSNAGKVSQVRGANKSCDIQ